MKSPVKTPKKEKKKKGKFELDKEGNPILETKTLTLNYPQRTKDFNIEQTIDEESKKRAISLVHNVTRYGQKKGTNKVLRHRVDYLNKKKKDEMGGETIIIIPVDSDHLAPIIVRPYLLNADVQVANAEFPAVYKTKDFHEAQTTLRPQVEEKGLLKYEYEIKDKKGKTKIIKIFNNRTSFVKNDTMQAFKLFDLVAYAFQTLAVIPYFNKLLSFAC